MISTDIKLILEGYDGEPGILNRHKGKLALGALGAAGAAGYILNPEFANDVDAAGRAFIKPAVKLLRHHKFIKDDIHNNDATDLYDEVQAKLRPRPEFVDKLTKKATDLTDKLKGIRVSSSTPK